MQRNKEIDRMTEQGTNEPNITNHINKTSITIICKSLPNQSLYI